MRSSQSLWTESKGWTGDSGAAADLVIIFGGTDAITDNKKWSALETRYPDAILMGCSTGGEIHGADVLDESLTATALSFEHTKLQSAEAHVQDPNASHSAGESIGRSLTRPALRSIFVLADGTRVNGSELIRGIRSVVEPNVVITGGLAGDGPRFGTTFVGLNAPPGRDASLRSVFMATGLLSATAVPAAGTYSAPNAASRVPTAMFFTNSTAKPRSIFTSAISVTTRKTFREAHCSFPFPSRRPAATRRL